MSATKPAWPPLPKVVDGALGPIRVRRVKQVDEAASRGEWDMERRVIKIERSRHRVNEWSTLFHELVHAALADADVHIGDDTLEERVCDAIALARVRELAKTLGL